MKLTAFALALAAGATSAMADDAKFSGYGTVEGWNIFIDHEKKSCLIEKIDEAQNVVQMGLTKDRGVGYVGVFTKAETDIKRDDKEAVVVLLGDHIYAGEVTGMRGNITKGYTGGYVLSDDPQLAEDIAREKVMVVFPETAYSFAINLDGTAKAIDAVRACNKEVQ